MHDIWVQTMIAYTNDKRMEGAAYRELWCQGYTVEDISGMCQVDEWRIQQGLRFER